MRLPLLFACLLCVTGQVSLADDALFALGADVCEKSLTGEMSGLDVDQYMVEIEATGADRDYICACVGENIAQLEADFGQTLRAEITSGNYSYLGFVLDQNISHCIEVADGMVFDGDLVGVDLEALAQEGDPISDNDDYNMCQMALEGGLMVPGFNEAEVLARIGSAGQSQAQVCRCTSDILGQRAAALQSEVEAAANPIIVYNSALAGAIEQCIG